MDTNTITLPVDEAIHSIVIADDVRALLGAKGIVVNDDYTITFNETQVSPNGANKEIDVTKVEELVVSINPDNQEEFLFSYRIGIIEYICRAVVAKNEAGVDTLYFYIN
jgi:hypothetical protein